MVRKREVLAGASAVAALYAASATGGTAGDEGLRAIAARRGIPFGIAATPDLLEGDAAFSEAAAREAAVLVPEGVAKWWDLRPAEAAFDFTGLDRLFRFAAHHGQTVRGHTLVWHAAMRPWTLAALEEGPARSRSILEAHFDGVLGRTAADIRDWDVANEAVADPRDSPELLKDTPWLRGLGPDYLDLAFRLARQHDAALTLTYNDYGCEQDTPVDDEKRRRVLALVRGMLDRGVPVDVVGLQGHLRPEDPFSAPKLAGFVRSLRQLGLKIALTEIDVIEPETRSDTAARDAAGAALVHAFVSTALDAAGGDGTTAVLCWGLSDRHSWINIEPGLPAAVSGSPARPLPLDAAYQRKPMWHALARAFEGRPWR